MPIETGVETGVLLMNTDRPVCRLNNSVDEPLKQDEMGWDGMGL